MKIIYFQKECNSNCGLVFLNLLKRVLRELNIYESIDIKNGVEEAMELGVSEIPALMINGELVASGFYLTKKQLIKIFKNQ